MYLDAIRHVHAGALLSIEVTPGVGVPYTVAEAAVERAKQLGSRRKLNSFERDDQVWVVFDRDEHPRHRKAIKLCEANGVKVARSNPCFELWLILHVTDYDKPDGRHAVQARLKELRADYDPVSRKWIDCGEIVDRVENAERRAELQLARRASEGAPYGRPSTTMYELTKAIRAASARYRGGG